MLRFTTTGTPFERGIQQGQACREATLPWFRPRIEAAARHPREDVEAWVERIRRVYPEGAEESRGIAVGMGLEERDYSAVLFDFLGAFPQCTTCGLRDEQNQPLLAKTDDLFASEVGKNVLETTLPDRGYRHTHFHFGAVVWTVAGMNERGLAMAMTGIPGPTLDEDGLPALLALHTILPQCATVSETMKHLKNLKVNRYGFSLLIGDTRGEMALVEKTGRGMTVLAEDRGVPLVHTNHILDAAFARQNPPQGEPVNTNGRRRYQNATAKAKVLPRTEEGLRALLADRNGVGAICQMGEEGLHTDFAVIFNPVQKQFTFWPGPPVSTPAETVRLSEIFADPPP